jgi:hypothetical protein
MGRGRADPGSYPLARITYFTVIVAIMCGWMEHTYL